VALVHMPHPHVPHPHAPHPHAGFDEHPWRALPFALVAIVVFAAVLIVVSFAISKAVAGRAY
jgi:hypothetical protein